MVRFLKQASALSFHMKFAIQPCHDLLGDHFHLRLAYIHGLGAHLPKNFFLAFQLFGEFFYGLLLCADFSFTADFFRV